MADTEIKDLTTNTSPASDDLLHIINDPTGAISDQKIALSDLLQEISVTAAETAAGVTPTDLRYPEGHVSRYGANTTPGTTDMTTAFQNALLSLPSAGGTVFIPAETFLISTGLVIPSDGVDINGEGEASLVTLSGAITGFTATNKNRINFSNFKITGASATGGIKIDRGATHSITNVVVANVNAVGSVSIHLLDPSHGVLSNVRCNGSSNAIGLLIESNTQNTGVHSIIGCEFGGSQSLLIGIKLLNTSSVVDSISFTGTFAGGTENAALLDGANIREIDFRGCHFENYTAATTIFLVEKAVHNLVIEACSFVSDGSATTGIHFNHASGSIIGVKIGNCDFVNIDAAGACIKKTDNAASATDMIITGVIKPFTTTPTLINDVSNQFRYMRVSNYYPFGGTASAIPSLAADATPSVINGETFKTSGTTAITDFDDGYIGQPIEIIATDNITITHGTPIRINGSVNFAMVVNDTLTLTMFNDGIWYETGRRFNATLETYTPSNDATDRSWDANAAVAGTGIDVAATTGTNVALLSDHDALVAVVQELSDVVATMATDLQARDIFQ